MVCLASLANAHKESTMKHTRPTRSRATVSKSTAATRYKPSVKKHHTKATNHKKASAQMKYKKIIIPVVTVLAVVALFAAGWFGKSFYDSQQRNAASNTAAAFVTNVATGDAVAAYEAMSPEIKESVSQEEFVDAWEAFAANSIDLSRPSVFSNSGGDSIYYTQTIYGTKEAVDGQNSVTISLMLNKSGSKWVVSLANVQ